MLTLTENCINGWSLLGIKKDSDPYGLPLINADVYYNGKKVGNYLECSFWGDLTRGELVDVLFNGSSNLAEEMLLERYHADGKLWHSYLEAQFGESFYNKESLVSVLVSMHEVKKRTVNPIPEIALNADFVLNYKRKEVVVTGKRFITYKATSYDLVTKEDFDNYVIQAKLRGDYPILLPSKYTCQ